MSNTTPFQQCYNLASDLLERHDSNVWVNVKHVGFSLGMTESEIKAACDAAALDLYEREHDI